VLAGYFVLLLPDDLRPVERLGELPEAPLLLVLPLNCATFFAVTGKLPRPLVVAADLRLLTFSFAVLKFSTFFLKFRIYDAPLSPRSISHLLLSNDISAL
jgi:hypothetical protein